MNATIPAPPWSTGTACSIRCDKVYVFCAGIASGSAVLRAEVILLRKGGARLEAGVEGAGGRDDPAVVLVLIRDPGVPLLADDGRGRAVHAAGNLQDVPWVEAHKCVPLLHCHHLPAHACTPTSATLSLHQPW